MTGGTRPLRRDQSRALHAYERVEAVPQDQRSDYKIAVQNLGAHILRGGLSAALAGLERQGDRKAVVRLLGDLAAFEIPGIESATGDDFAAHVRRLDAPRYMLATRDALKCVVWLKRAVQATFQDEDGHA